MILFAKEISKSFNQTLIIDKLTLTIPTGSMTSIIGPSGSGKTTLLNLLSTLDQPDSGSVILNGVHIHTLKGAELAEFRNKKIGFIFQFHNLLPEFTLFENICLPGYIGHFPKQDVEQKAYRLISLLGLNHCMHALPMDSSGGERQRAAVARALINSPDIIFADEPSGSLDSKNATLLHDFLLELCKSYKQTIICVTHNPLLSKMADHTFYLKDGLLQPT